MLANDQRQMGRAKNAVLSFFERSLSIPKIYIDADWTGHHVDVLAIDRDGVGDVHAVLLFQREPSTDAQYVHTLDMRHAGELIDTFSAIPAQYKYIGAVNILQGDLPGLDLHISKPILDMSLHHDGIGRTGFLKVTVPLDGDPKVNLEVKPERFRASVLRLADEYVGQHEADWEIRA
jgi:hypothetical protein